MAGFTSYTTRSAGGTSGKENPLIDLFLKLDSFLKQIKSQFGVFASDMRRNPRTFLLGYAFLTSAAVGLGLAGLSGAAAAGAVAKKKGKDMRKYKEGDWQDFWGAFGKGAMGKIEEKVKRKKKKKQV